MGEEIESGMQGGFAAAHASTEQGANQAQLPCLLVIARRYTLEEERVMTNPPNSLGKSAGSAGGYGSRKFFNGKPAAHKKKKLKGSKEGGKTAIRELEQHE